MLNMMLKCAESEADMQQHLHKRSAEAVVAGQTSMGAHFSIFGTVLTANESVSSFGFTFPSTVQSL